MIIFEEVNYQQLSKCNLQSKQLQVNETTRDAILQHKLTLDDVTLRAIQYVLKEGQVQGVTWLTLDHQICFTSQIM